MKINFKELAAPYENAALESLKGIVKIDSVYDEKTKSEKDPFGKGVSSAISYWAQLAKQHGFEVDTCDNYACEIKCGKGDKIIGVYAHTDVVPVSGDWKYPPFSATIKNNVMYSRGTSDDKGPAVAAFYALVLLKDHGLIDDSYQVRLVLGGDEERGGSCLEHYFKELKKPDPTYGFTPDGGFPVVFGEKGIANYLSEAHVNLYPVVSISGGVASNCVIDKATAVVLKDDGLKELLDKSKFKYDLSSDDKFSTITIYGKSAHGSTPELGVNAAIQLCQFLGDTYDLELLSNFAHLYSDTSGKLLGGFYSTKNMHDTTYNVGLISYDKSVFSFVTNFRYPENVVVEDVLSIIEKATQLRVILQSKTNVLYFDPNSPFIKTLVDIYAEETGDTVTKGFSMGGGTYAKEVKNCVAFGSSFPDEKDAQIHSPNEFIELPRFYKQISIYSHAIYDLAKKI